MSFTISSHAATLIAGGLIGLMNVESGPTNEQQAVYNAFARHLLNVDIAATDFAYSLAPGKLVTALEDPVAQRLFTQMAIMLEMCRHPRSEVQLAQLETYAGALNFHGPQLDAVRGLLHNTAEHATADFLRVYDDSIPLLTEPQFQQYGGRPPADDSLWQQLQALQEMPRQSLGREFHEFYERNGLTLPGPTTPQPGYYVAHDMNHVIAGYEPTGPGEIALGIFKLMMNNSEANWMGSMVNFLIHEVGLFKHAKSLQFVPYGGDGEPYHGLQGRRGAMTMEGAPELVAEAFLRGAATTADFADMDHLANARRPLVEIREAFHVIPLQQSMCPDEDPALWPGN